MQICADAALLTRDERLREVATVFSVGLLRLRGRARLSLNISEKNPIKPPASCLEVSDETVLSVPTG